MPITISSINGLGGDPPTQIAVKGTVSGCDVLFVTMSCSAEGVRQVDIRRGGVWSVTFNNDKGCACGSPVTVVASCHAGMTDQVEEALVLSCDPPPPRCCDSVTVAVDTAPLPCVGEGGKVAVQCSATASPADCTDAFEWSVSELATGSELHPFTAGGRTFSYSYPKAGRYRVTVRVTQDDRCEARILSDSVELTLAACAAVDACIGGELVADCRLDLPKNDVVESIDFERFFRLDLRFGDLQDATTPAPTPADEGAPGLANIGALSLALFLPFRQDWKLCGYCRGRLVNSFSLGPEEEQTVEIFKWDRITRNMESGAEFEAEDTTESSSTRRDTSDVARDVSREAGFDTNSKGNVGFTVGVAKFNIDAGLNARTALKEGEKATRAAIVEATAKATGRVRTSRTLKVVETRESGQETRTTRRLRNANKCNTLTVAFFEILANYLVSTYVRTDAVRLVVLVESSDLIRIAGFDRATVRTHERSLRLALLDSTLADGFAAARFLDARDRACAVLCAGCGCRPDTGASGSEWTAVQTAADALGVVVAALRTTAATIDIAFRAAVPLLGLPAPVAPALATVAKRYLFFKSLRTYAPQLLGQLSGVGVGGGAATVTASQVEDIARFLGLSPADTVSRLSYDKGASDAVGAEAYGIFVASGRDPIIAAPTSLGIFWTRASGLFDDQGFVAAINTFRGAYDTWKKFLQEQKEKDEKAAAQEKIDRAEREARILENFPLRETADAAERLDALIAHLNDPRNVDHYRFAIWNERSGATDDTLISLALAGLIDPTPVGMVGDLLAVPIVLAPGSKAATFFADSIVDLVEQFERTDEEHILPTPALFAESILGECCACDGFLREHRRLDLADKQAQVDLATQLAAQAAHESERRRLRLAQTTPDLSPLEPAEAAALHVVVENAPAPPPAAGGTP
jgi:hypothetical protein